MSWDKVRSKASVLATRFIENVDHPDVVKNFDKKMVVYLSLPLSVLALSVISEASAVHSIQTAVESKQMLKTQADAILQTYQGYADIPITEWMAEAKKIISLNSDLPAFAQMKVMGYFGSVIGAAGLFVSHLKEQLSTPARSESLIKEHSTQENAEVNDVNQAVDWIPRQMGQATKLSDKEAKERMELFRANKQFEKMRTIREEKISPAWRDQAPSFRDR